MNRSDQALLDLLALYRLCGGGSVSCLRALEQHGEAAAALAAARRDPALAARWPEARDEAAIDLAWLRQNGVHALAHADPRYPPLLRRIPDPPALLFVRGDLDALWAPQLAVVGSRQATAGGLATARDFAATLCASGFAITSGLAAGIDAAAHEGALAAGAWTLAVLGTGPDQIYPPRHKGLAERVAQSGAVLSEFLPRSPARRSHFPRRNRIISGLALGTLVVEAGLASGSLITARGAIEQGREVFAIPGSIHNPLAKGCHQLIREGAKLVESAQEILVELSPLVAEWRDSLRALPAAQGESGLVAFENVSREGNDDPDYAELRRALGYDPVPMDALVNRTGLTVPVLSSMLLRMELDGEVVCNPGGTYSRSIGSR